MDPEPLPREAETVVRLRRTTVWHFFRMILKKFHCPPQLGKELSETDKKNSVVFVQVRKEKLKEKPIFL